MIIKRLFYKTVRIAENDLGIHVFPDKTCVQSEYFSVFGREINWKNPETFNEKLQWLKFFDRQPIYPKLVDKYAVKQYIADKIGDRFVIKTYGVWDSFDDIDRDALPDQFVIKCTHDSGSICICKDKGRFDWEQCRNVIEKSLQRNFYYIGREWVYKEIKPRIMAEAYIQDTGNNEDLTDYKIHCFNGEPKVILVCKNRFDQSGLQESFFDTNWNLLDLKRPGRSQCIPEPPKPPLLDEMLDIAKKLSAGIPFLRVDLYLAKGQVYFGELTFYPASGFIPFEPETYDKQLGDWLILNDKNNY